MLTPREMEILDVLRKGIHSPTLLAAELGITQSGATQALQKLEKKAAVTRTKIGRNVFYRPIEDEKPETPKESDEDIELIMESYHALSKIWSHLLRLDLTHEELAKVRDARNILEEILVRRVKSLD
ncbi:MAG: helix-turn-helix domain-containing protein [Candidatus Thermoplasmatota archaeon]|nr:helix-turn-helix domain-containing protein [Candidatus Thermoplasmatota archaeon]MBU1915245.1 helix-turn-helix domain-containing protein [Candidatus Thermoplasmatota archaeon]